MQITIDLPDEYIQRLEPDLDNLPQHILEALVVEAYKAQRLTNAEVGQILKLNRFEVDALLKQHQAYLHYTIADFNQDLQTLQQIQQQQQ
jgi:predicted HTH domain antitoxin